MRWRACTFWAAWAAWCSCTSLARVACSASAPGGQAPGNASAAKFRLRFRPSEMTCAAHGGSGLQLAPAVPCSLQGCFSQAQLDRCPHPQVLWVRHVHHGLAGRRAPRRSQQQAAAERSGHGRAHGVAYLHVPARRGRAWQSRRPAGQLLGRPCRTAAMGAATRLASMSLDKPAPSFQVQTAVATPPARGARPGQTCRHAFCKQRAGRAWCRLRMRTRCKDRQASQTCSRACSQARQRDRQGTL